MPLFEAETADVESHRDSDFSVRLDLSGAHFPG